MTLLKSIFFGGVGGAVDVVLMFLLFYSVVFAVVPAFPIIGVAVIGIFHVAVLLVLVFIVAVIVATAALGFIFSIHVALSLVAICFKICSTIRERTQSCYINISKFML